ncbi:C-C chemokine receptor type 10 [Tachysurus fulvidraco]|uniref:C-C chemokine receptor type 10 n=1 Tax=Tachysurus fulvidraco TaxID=1234273 RepID=UPI000F4DFA02|nr:C-C chemokine receptor type 10 [Tachysurus fulvidraco]
MDENSTSYNAKLENVTQEYSDYYENCTGNNCSPIEMCESDNSHELASMAVQVTVYIIAFLLGVIGNSLVIATFAKYRRMRLRCMTDVFLFYLAISDLLLLLTLPLQTTEIILGSWMLGEEMCKINHGLCAINTYSGLLLLACISIDRYMLVVWAKAAQALRPSMLCYSKLSVIAVVVASFLLSLPELLTTSVNPESSRCEYRRNDYSNVSIKMWPRVAKITGCFVPFVAMLVCYSAIGHVLMQGRGKCFRRQKTLRLIVALILLFLLFQQPYAIMLSIQIFMTSDTCEVWSGIHLALDITRSLAYVRCCLNPLLYALVGVRFRNDVMRLLRDCGCICACLSHLIPKLEHGSSATPSSPPLTSTVPYDLNSPKFLLDSAKNPEGVPQESYTPNIFFPSTFPEFQKPGGIVYST